MPPVEPLTTEYRKENLRTAADTDYAEHDVFSAAKKIVQVSEALVLNGTLELYTRNEAPSTPAFAAAIAFDDLNPNAAYRYISNRHSHIALKRTAGVASTVAVTDFYIPANTPYIFKTDKLWKRLEAIPATGEAAGIAQLALVR